MIQQLKSSKSPLYLDIVKLITFNLKFTTDKIKIPTAKGKTAKS